MGRVAEILALKGTQIHSVDPRTTVHEAIAHMVEHNIGAVLVLEADRPVGIFTERDHLRRVTLPCRDPLSTPVRDVMSRELIYVEPDKSVEECMAIMTRGRIRHLPVMSGDRIAGMISIGDLVKHVSRQQEVEIHHLTQYISGNS